MTVQDLLDELRQVYLDDYTDLVEGDPDTIWSDAQLIRALNQAENMVCRRTHCLVSVGADIPAMLQLTLVDGTRDYTYDQRILAVMSLRLNDSEVDMTKAPYNIIRQTNSLYFNDEYFNINVPSVADTGRPQWWAPDVKSRTIQFRPTPAADEDGLIANLRAVHLPENQMSLNDLGASPEIDEQYHEVLPMLAAAKLLNAPNVDSQSRSASRENFKMAREMLSMIRSEQMARKGFPGAFRFGRWGSE